MDLHHSRLSGGRRHLEATHGERSTGAAGARSGIVARRHAQRVTRNHSPIHLQLNGPLPDTSNGTCHGEADEAGSEIAALVRGWPRVPQEWLRKNVDLLGPLVPRRNRNSFRVTLKARRGEIGAARLADPALRRTHACGALVWRERFGKSSQPYRGVPGGESSQKELAVRNLRGRHGDAAPVAWGVKQHSYGRGGRRQFRPEVPCRHCVRHGDSTTPCDSLPRGGLPRGARLFPECLHTQRPVALRRVIVPAASGDAREDNRSDQRRNHLSPHLRSGPTAGGTPCPVTAGAYTAIGTLLSTKMITAGFRAQAKIVGVASGCELCVEKARVRVRPDRRELLEALWKAHA